MTSALGNFSTYSAWMTNLKLWVNVFRQRDINVQVGIQYAEVATIEVAAIAFHKISGKEVECCAERVQVSLEHADITRVSLCPLW